MTLTAPEEVLGYWIGPTRESADQLKAYQRVWFGKDDTVDRQIADRFLETLRQLVSGKAYDWAEQGPRPRLAAIIVLDQFSRNLFRGLPDAFAQDDMALGLTKDGLMKGEDTELSEVERVFFYLPLEHSERQADQALCVSLMESLAASCRPGFEAYAADTLDYAQRHKAVIDRFGRFPHRNAVLGRESTVEERDFLSQPGSRF